MITYSIIKKSQLEGAKRLDAEYYQPEYLELTSKLKKQNSKPLGDIATIAYGTTPSGGIFEPNGIPFIRSQNFSNVLVDKSDIVFCTEKFNNQNKKTSIKPGDVLFAAVGATIGQLAIVQDEIKEGNINQNIARVRIIDKDINPYFVGLFFSSKPGQLQIERLTTGNAQPYLNSEHFRSFLVPVFNKDMQKTIAALFQNIQSQIKLSHSLYSQAENLLLEELGLKNFENEGGLFSVVNLSEVKNANRMDAEYFDPKYNQLQKILKDVRCLSDVAERITKRADIQPKSEYNYIEISDVNAGNGEITSNKILGQYLPANAKIKVSGGELIVSKVRPTRGAIAIIPDNWNKDFVLSGAFSVFKIESPMREYLQVLLRSFVGKLQLEKPTTGTSYPTITDEDVGNILIQILPKPTQQKIAELAQKSHEARQKAKNLLEEAKQKVEDLIENSGK